MTVSPKAIAEYLDRKLDNHSWLKELDESKIDDALFAIKPSPMKYVEGLRIAQKVVFLLCVANPQFFIMLDMGLGKSCIALRLISYFSSIGKIRNLAVTLVPTDAAVDTWVDECAIWAPDLPFEPILGTFDQKWRAYHKLKSGLVVMTYTGYSAMVSDMVPVPKKQKRERKPVDALLNQAADRVDALVMDESPAVGNVQSLNYETTRALSFAADIRYALAGRPFGRDPRKVWSQCFLVDHGASLSNSYGLFMEAFFDRKKAFWGVNRYEYKFNKKREPDLARALAHRSLSYTIDECIDMPEMTPVVRRVNFPTENNEHYKRVVARLVENRGNFHEVENAFIRMRQIASGFLGFTDDDTGEKAQIEFKHNPKLDELLEILDTIPEGEKFLIFHEYTWSGARLCKALAQKKIKHGWLWGGTTDWPAMKQRFNTDENYQGLVINHKKGAESLNLQRANWVFVYESPVSPIAREQMERRAWRGGQTRRVMLYDLVVRDSVEERLLAFHRQGENLFEALVKDPQRTLLG